MFFNPGLTCRGLPSPPDTRNQRSTHLAAPPLPDDEFYVSYIPRDFATRRAAREGARRPRRLIALHVWLPILFPFCRVFQELYRLLVAPIAAAEQEEPAAEIIRQQSSALPYSALVGP